MNSLTMCSGQGVGDTMRSKRKKSVVVKDIRYDPHSRNLLYHTLLKWNLEALCFKGSFCLLSLPSVFHPISGKTTLVNLSQVQWYIIKVGCMPYGI